MDSMGTRGRNSQIRDTVVTPKGVFLKSPSTYSDSIRSMPRSVSGGSAWSVGRLARQWGAPPAKALLRKTKQRFALLRGLRQGGEASKRFLSAFGFKRKDKDATIMEGQGNQKVKDKEIQKAVMRRRIPKFLILHFSPFKAVWDWVIHLLVLYTAVSTPYFACFLMNEDKARSELNKDSETRLKNAASNQMDVLVVIDLLVDVMFLVDILINFRTTYVHSGDVITDPRKIAMNYIKGWFWIDAIAAVPFDLLLFGTGSSDTITVTGVLKTARLLRLIRVIKRMDQYTEYGAAMLLLLMAIFTLIGHWLACIFYAITYAERPALRDPISWLDKLADQMDQPYMANDTLSGPDINSKYITALYFVFTTLTSIGFGNIAPNTDAEKIFSIFAMLLGSLMSAAILGNVSSIMLRVYQGSDDFHEKQTSIKEFISFHHIPKELARRLEESFQQDWTYTKGIDMHSVLKSFPDCLQADICLHLNRNLINNYPAFLDASPGCRRTLSMKFRSTHAPPGDTLIHPGDVLNALFFIARGSVEVTYNNAVIAVLGKDDSFGEDMQRAHLTGVGKSNFFVKALSYCDLHKIEREDLLTVMQMHPDFAIKFRHKFKVTFNLREADGVHRMSKRKYDDETLRFIQAKRPHFQTTHTIPIPDRLEKRTQLPNTILETPVHQSEVVASSAENSDSDATEPDFRKRAVTVIEEESSQSGSAKDMGINGVGIAPSLDTMEDIQEDLLDEETPLMPKLLTKEFHLSLPAFLEKHPSSISSSSPEPQSPQTVPDRPFSRTDVRAESSQQYAPTDAEMLKSLDRQLTAFARRMDNFEIQMFNTVDAILETLGHAPSVCLQQDYIPPSTVPPGSQSSISHHFATTPQQEYYPTHLVPSLTASFDADASSENVETDRKLDASRNVAGSESALLGSERQQRVPQTSASFGNGEQNRFSEDSEAANSLVPTLPEIHIGWTETLGKGEIEQDGEAPVILYDDAQT